MRTMYYAKIKDTLVITGLSDELNTFNTEPLANNKILFLFSEEEKENRDLLDVPIDDGDTLGDFLESGALEWIPVEVPISVPSPDGILNKWQQIIEDLRQKCNQSNEPFNQRIYVMQKLAEDLIEQCKLDLDSAGLDKLVEHYGEDAGLAIHFVGKKD